MAVDTLRPDADISIGTWVDDGGGTTDIFQAIDEVSPSDVDFIRTANNPALQVCEIGLSNPGAGTIASLAHVLSYRYAKSASGGRNIDLRVRLLQGTTEIVSFDHVGIKNVVAQADQILPPRVITDYDDLRVEFRGNDTTGSGAARRCHVHWAELILAELDVKTIGATARDYSTVTLWEASHDNTTYPNANTVAQGEMYNDGNFDENFTINAQPTNLTGVVLTVASGERHDGTEGTGVVNLRTANNGIIQSYDSAGTVFVVRWLEQDYNGNRGTSNWSFLREGGMVDHTIHHGISSPAGTTSFNIGLFAGKDTAVHNNILYDCKQTSTAFMKGLDIGSQQPDSIARIFNNTVVDIGIMSGSSAENVAGMLMTDDASHTYKNNIVMDTANAGSGTAVDYDDAAPSNADVDFNMASDTTASGAGSRDSEISSDIFVSVTGGSEDFHLKTGSNAIDNGTDLGILPFEVNIDIDERDRDAEGDTWDMGVDEFVAAAAALFLPIHGRKMSMGLIQR